LAPTIISFVFVILKFIRFRRLKDIEQTEVKRMGDLEIGCSVTKSFVTIQPAVGVSTIPSSTS